MSDQLITVATFNFTTDPSFLLFKAALKHHNIEYFAADENTVNADPLLSILVGGIRVLVHEDDVPVATGIWREICEIDQEEVNFGEQNFMLNDLAGQTIIKTSKKETKSNAAYFIFVVALISLLLLVLLIAILIEL